jgi:hypothetical protein
MEQPCPVRYADIPRSSFDALPHVLGNGTRPLCCDLMKPDTSIGGEIAAVSGVLNKKKGSSGTHVSRLYLYQIEG